MALVSTCKTMDIHVRTYVAGKVHTDINLNESQKSNKFFFHVFKQTHDMDFGVLISTANVTYMAS